ncbi:MAG: hypothetical protein CL678_10545 [Bdellovibrionaceae bacterium]|nr:hypothetical protein [Pseudobdellovibrionaceae bacterium]|tara:strand:- start:1736 stop:2254 length:519 start_codon:yes stop_codon:yes gene_type:complete
MKATILTIASLLSISALAEEKIHPDFSCTISKNSVARMKNEERITGERNRIGYATKIHGFLIENSPKGYTHMIRLEDYSDTNKGVIGFERDFKYSRIEDLGEEIIEYSSLEIPLKTNHQNPLETRYAKFILDFRKKPVLNYIIQFRGTIDKKYVGIYEKSYQYDCQFHALDF